MDLRSHRHADSEFQPIYKLPHSLYTDTLISFFFALFLIFSLVYLCLLFINFEGRSLETGPKKFLKSMLSFAVVHGLTQASNPFFQINPFNTKIPFFYFSPLNESDGQFENNISNHHFHSGKYIFFFTHFNSTGHISSQILYIKNN